MEKKKKADPRGVVRIPQKQNVLQHRQKLPRDDVHESFFTIDSNDFPSLNEVSVKQSSHSKTSPEVCKTSFSYSDKLKAPPQEGGSQCIKFDSACQNVDHPGSKNNQKQSSITRNKSFFKKQNDFQTNPDTPKPRRHNLINGETSFMVKRELPFNKNQGQTNCKTDSSMCLSREERSESSGWTSNQRHSSTQRNEADNKYNTTTNLDRNSCLLNPRGAHNSNIVNRKTDKPYNSTAKNEPNFNKYKHSNQLVKRLSESTNDKGVSSVAYQRSHERCTSEIKKEVPQNSKTGYNFNEKSKHLKRNPDAENVPTVQRHGIRPTFTNKPPDDSGVDTRNRITTGDKNVLSVSSLEHGHTHRVSLQHYSKNTNPEHVPANSEEVKKKKKRKSKVKRQAALQTGKIFILTPEAHSKILNQSNSTNMQPQKKIVTNINDAEEYPELGIAIGPKISIENPVKTTGISLKQGDTSLTPPQCASVLQDCNEDSGGKHHETVDVKEEPNDVKLPVHSNDPITVSLFDMLLTTKTKKKEPEEKIEVEPCSVENLPTKIKVKKVVRRPVNPLDSSRPAVKRGKEREQPKVKKPSRMRKLILLGRKMKRESMVAKDSETCNNDKSDLETDTLSDGSSLSPTKSPGCNKSENATELYNATEDISLLDNIIEPDHQYSLSPTSYNRGLYPTQELQENELLLTNESLLDHYSLVESEDTALNNSDSSMSLLDPSSSPCLPHENGSYNVEFVEESKCILHINDVKNNFINQNFRSSKTFEEKTELSERTSPGVESSEMNNVYEDRLINFRWLSENENLTHFENNTVESYCNALTLSILDDCVTEICRFLRNKNDFVTNQMSNSDYQNGHELHSEDCIADITLLFEKQNLVCRFSEMSNSTRKDFIESVFPFEVGFFDINRQFESEAAALTFFVNSNNHNVSNFSEHVFASGNKAIDVGDALHSSFESDCSFEEKLGIGSCVELECEKFTSSLSNSSEQMGIEHPMHIFSDEERRIATKIILHSRKFRDYCNHFASKELDKAAFSLLDDLARFQDRMHQKDPVKAKVRRRLIYGIKEIKKHMKLKKLKGIILATDIEDNKTEGGLNDLVNEIISLAETYHIPYVFSHRKFNLGKVCRKPSPVSCVGIFNYEGSEKNFKKMLELQDECKHDYLIITKKIAQELTEGHIASLFKAVQETPFTPLEIKKEILTELFGLYLIDKECEKHKLPLKPKNSSAETEPKISNRMVEAVSSLVLENSSLVKELTNLDSPTDLKSSNASLKSESPVAATESKVSLIIEKLKNPDEYKSFRTLEESEEIKIPTILKMYNIMKD